MERRIPPFYHKLREYYPAPDAAHQHGKQYEPPGSEPSPLARAIAKALLHHEKYYPSPEAEERGHAIVVQEILDREGK